MPTIKKIRLINYKRFTNYTVEPNDRINILVGDNEVGKSTILEAIDIVVNASVRKVEAIGVDKLLNIDSVKQFTAGERNFYNLPSLTVELYLQGSFDHTMNGKNNSSGIPCDGIRLVCEANEDFLTEITASLQAHKDYFPYDYYSIRFSTFADQGYTGLKKKIRSVFIDSSNMSTEYAINDYIKRMYNQYTEENTKERAVHKSEYRQLKSSFRENCLTTLNQRLPIEKAYAFGLKTGASSSLENDLMIYEDEIGIDSKGTGKQVIIKTDFALERSGSIVDVILIEEPENHLSHVNLKKLIQRVSETQNGQLFISTHNSLVSTRLELQNLLIMHTGAELKPTSLNSLHRDTAKYFMKAPVANIIEFVVSPKVILLEGPSEYMLFEQFYFTETGHKPEDDNVHIMDVYGLSFKRFLEIAQSLELKVAVVTDNDGNYQKNCVDKYAEYSKCKNIEVFYDENNSMKTFEDIIYNENRELCDELFNNEARDYMLKNKTESAFRLLTKGEPITVPRYMQGAIRWIKD